jgi:hypothetical protein
MKTEWMKMMKAQKIKYQKIKYLLLHFMLLSPPTLLSLCPHSHASRLPRLVIVLPLVLCCLTSQMLALVTHGIFTQNKIH